MPVTKSYTDLDERLGATSAKSRSARPGGVATRFTAPRVGFDDLAADEED